MLKTRQELEENLVGVIQSTRLKQKKKDVEDIKKHLLENFDISSGSVQMIINDPENHLEELDLRQLYLITEQVYAKTGKINPDEYFTEVEKRESKKFNGLMEKNEKEFNFPITFQNAMLVGNNAYMVTMDIQVIDKLMSSQNLQYDYELQREATFKRRKDTIVMQPTVNRKNIKEISEHLINGTLVPTVLVFNARPLSSPTGTELIFDHKKAELTITNETELSVLDGYHRCIASQNALQLNPELHFNFAVLITNYSTKKAQQYQAQLAQATPLNKARVAALQANRLADDVLQKLREESDLRGRISQTNRIHSLNKELVTLTIADSIDEQFKLETKLDSIKVGSFLTEFFNYLLGMYPNEFINNIEETRKISLINDSNIFSYGYITLARRMYEKSIAPENVYKYIEQINFNRDNSQWDGLDENGNIADTNKFRKSIKKYFEEINL